MSSIVFMDWERRMGIHYAYHQSVGNRVLHAVTIPLIFRGIVMLLRQLSFFGTTWDWGFILCGATAPLWIATEPLGGSTFAVFLFAMHQLSPSLGEGVMIEIALLVLAFVIQVKVGHDVLEPNQRDDTERNLAELHQTKNPLPIVLIFYYHWLMEGFLIWGYRPALKKRIQKYMNDHLNELGQMEQAKQERKKQE